MPVYPPAAASVLSPGLLATKVYNPAVAAYVSTASATPADLDATNLAVSFTAPPSGRVLVRMTTRVSVAANTDLLWNLREGSSDVAGTSAIIHYIANQYGGERISHVCEISGLTPGTTKTYKWGHARGSGGACETGMGGTAGPAVMEVWDAAPTYSQQLLTGVRPQKRVRRVGGGNYSFLASSYTAAAAFDATNFPFQTIPCQLGDLIELTWNFQHYGSAAINPVYLFEVDRPTSANEYTDADATYQNIETIDGTRRWREVSALYVVTEAGINGFRPALRFITSANTLTVCNASSGADGTPITFLVQNLGATAV